MSSIADQLKNINMATLKLSNGMTMEQVLRKEAQRLKNCIQKYIDEYYNSYSPEYYDRTYCFQRSFSVDDILEVDVAGNQLKIYLLFDDDLANHSSLWGGNDGYVPALINDEWHWSNDTVHREHFSYYDGFHYLEKGIDEFNKSNPYGIHVEIIRD